MSNIRVGMNLEQVIKYINQLPIGYLVIDERGSIIAINQILLQASNYAEIDLLNQPYDILIEFDGSKEDFFEILKSSSLDSHFQLRWRDFRNNLQYSKVLIWRLLRPKFFILGFLDIQKPKQMDLLSRFAESFVSEINIGIIVIDNNLKIIEISPLVCRLLNVEKKQVINRPIDEVFSDIPDEHRIVQRTLIDGIIISNHAIVWTMDHKKYELLIDSNLIRDEKGGAVGAYVVFKDVTNLRSLEQQVCQNDRLVTIGQIAAGTAHEIRNPLTSIKGFMQILKNSLLNNGLVEEIGYIEIVLSEIERINKLVSEILLLSKPKDIVHKPTDVNSVLKAILPIIQNESLLHGVEVKYELNHLIPLVSADSELLKQVFLNIAKNGIEAMSEGGILTISTDINKAQKRVEILIQDTGPGIPNYIVDKIFEPFFTTKGTGTGLGLSISQKIIHDLGGNIRILNKGFGTTFQIKIPFI
ncbi:hypothetical protein BHF71_08120 [Vulcanibacillus modesticaldus]|uniref:histidine kinase n=1 Tax=Vulcanibacillus modesticaldus TaxID=337097 RepID=A0A1D2YV88_9BACI|nr:PAS domain-containing sensor histidine kinase [Vulcanibacillus modesticaldus]OEF99642.1 hypothetical protein BHF71_08120 [Vulcanibacillus modesticaldus]